MQSGFGRVVPHTRLRHWWVAGRSDSLSLTPAPLPSTPILRRRRDGGRRGPPRLPCQQLLTSSLASDSGGRTAAGGLPYGGPRSRWALGSPPGRRDDARPCGGPLRRRRAVRSSLPPSEVPPCPACGAGLWGPAPSADCRAWRGRGCAPHVRLRARGCVGGGEGRGEGRAPKDGEGDGRFQPSLFSPPLPSLLARVQCAVEEGEEEGERYSPDYNSFDPDSSAIPSSPRDLRL